MATLNGIANKAGTAWILRAIWLLLFALGAIAVAQRFTHGHEYAAYGSYVPWGLWVAAYIYFVGLSAGCYMLSSFIFVFQVEKLKQIGRLSLFLALVTLPTGLLSILFDLGHMGRFYYIFIRPNFGSMMTWMVWLYTVYCIIIVWQLVLALRPVCVKFAEDGDLRGRIARWVTFGRTSLTSDEVVRNERLLRTIALFGIPLVLAFSGGVGALFATVAGRPYWHSALFPILFLTGALVSGTGLLTAVLAFFWPKRDSKLPNMVNLLGKMVLGLIVFNLILEFAEFSIPMWYRVGGEFELMNLVLFGPYWYVFWIVHLIIGCLVPIAILAYRRKSVFATGVAGLLVAVTFLAVRLNIVVPGQVDPQLHGLERSYTDSKLVFEYAPSLWEWQVVLFAVMLGIGLFFIGARLLPVLHDEQE